MTGYLLELSILGFLIIGITAFSAVIVQGIGQNIFGRKSKDHFTSQSKSIQANWKIIGGKNKSI
jgi:hypothetical protein